MTDTQDEEKKSGGFTLAIVLIVMAIAIFILYILYNRTRKGNYNSDSYFIADLFSTMLMTIITAPFEMLAAMAGG